MAAELALVDTNVLIAAVHSPREHHDAALALLAGSRELAVSGQVIREFLVTATRPAEVNGLGLPSEAAANNANTFVERMTLLPEDARVTARLLQLIVGGFAAGVQIHDANLVATALTHGISRLITSNVRHFARFADLVEIVPLR